MVKDWVDARGLRCCSRTFSTFRASCSRTTAKNDISSCHTIPYHTIRARLDRLRANCHNNPTTNADRASSSRIRLRHSLGVSHGYRREVCFGMMVSCMWRWRPRWPYYLHDSRSPTGEAELWALRCWLLRASRVYHRPQGFSVPTGPKK